jgi:hypothetical protein
MGFYQALEKKKGKKKRIKSYARRFLQNQTAHSPPWQQQKSYSFLNRMHNKIALQHVHHPNQ